MLESLYKVLTIFISRYSTDLIIRLHNSRATGSCPYNSKGINFLNPRAHGSLKWYPDICVWTSSHIANNQTCLPSDHFSAPHQAYCSSATSQSRPRCLPSRRTPKTSYPETITTKLVSQTTASGGTVVALSLEPSGMAVTTGGA